MKFVIDDEKDLIPVHINSARCDNYFWDWSYDLNKWVRAGEIPEHLKRMYKHPKAN